MLERTAFYGDPRCRHFLLLAPRHGFAVVVVTLGPHCCTTTCYGNDIAVVRNYMVLEAVFAAAAAVNFVVDALATWQRAPLPSVYASCLALAVYCASLTWPYLRNPGASLEGAVDEGEVEAYDIRNRFRRCGPLQGRG